MAITVNTICGNTVTMNQKGICLYNKVGGYDGRFCIGFKDTNGSDWYWGVGGNGWSRGGMIFDSVEALAIMNLINEVQNYGTIIVA